MFRRDKGMALLELMAVIGIIAILVAIALAVYLNTRKGVDDKRRLSDVKMLVMSIDQYKRENGSFPPAPGASDRGTGGWDVSGVGEFIRPLSTDGYIKESARDPKFNDFYGNYRYYRYGAGSYGADPARGAYYVLGVRYFDDRTSGARIPHPESPGWSTPGRNWQGEMEWVTGGYTN